MQHRGADHEIVLLDVEHAVGHVLASDDAFMTISQWASGRV
jgi:hypothetical protein